MLFSCFTCFGERGSARNAPLEMLCQSIYLRDSRTHLFRCQVTWCTPNGWNFGCMHNTSTSIADKLCIHHQNSHRWVLTQCHIRVSVDAVCWDGVGEISLDPHTKSHKTQRGWLAKPSKHTSNSSRAYL